MLGVMGWSKHLIDQFVLFFCAALHVRWGCGSLFLFTFTNKPATLPTNCRLRQKLLPKSFGCRSNFHNCFFLLPAFKINIDIGNFKPHSIFLCQARVCDSGRGESSQIPSVHYCTDGNLSCPIEPSTSLAVGETELPNVTKHSHNTTDYIMHVG